MVHGLWIKLEQQRTYERFIHVEENGNWTEAYFGDQGIVKENSSYSKRDNKHVIQLTKLKSLQARKAQDKLDI